MRRVVTPELMDTDSGTPAEVAAALRDLQRVNRWFGGTRTTEQMLLKVAHGTGKRELHLLDVAAGSGDIALAAQRRLQLRGLTVDVTVSDRAVSHLRLGVNGHNHRRAVAADAFSLPFADNSFDAVSCALFIHHLEPDEVVRFVNEALRVARVAVLMNDLRRSTPHLALIVSGFVFMHSRIFRHDSIASVRRSYTRTELQALLEQTRASRVDISNHYLYRMGAIAWN